jgi:tetratricopeptide (TPR) repeat protein/WD40 repeat protein
MNEHSIFLAVLAIDDPTERAAYLDRACAGDPDLRSQVEQLLKARQVPGRPVDRTAPERRAEGLAAPEKLGETQGETKAGETDVQELGFLTPSSRPGVLGRLGRYEVLEVIGRGGMGVVLQAFDQQLRRMVAIKVMAAHLATNATARKRFTREARAAAAVCHDHVVTIHAVEEARGLPYLVMKHVAGLTLKQRLDRQGPLPIKEVLRIGMETAAGLAAAHARGLIHRDIKPANILLEGEAGASATGGRVKITDFGLARAADDASLTQSGVVAGTPDYMSPEQARGEALDARTDLFSLGSVLYATCTGKAPFHAGDTMAILHRVCEEAPTPIREINPEVPDWLVAVVDKLLAKDPAQRFQSAAEVAEVLQRHLLHPPQPRPAPRPRPEEKPGPRPRRRRWPLSWRWRIVAVAALLIVAAAGLLACQLYLVKRGDGTRVGEVGGPEAEAAAPEKIGVIRQIEWPGRHTYQTVFSPDGRLFLVAGSAGPGHTIKVWELATGRLALEFPGNEKGVFTPDGKQVLAAGFDKSLHLWDVATGQEVRTFPAQSDWINTLALDPDGKQALASSNDGAVRWYDVTTGNVIGEWKGAAGDTTHAVLAPDGRRALTCTYRPEGRIIELWETASAQRLKAWTDAPHVRNPLLGFTPDGNQFLTVADDGIRYRSAADGELVKLVSWPADLAPHLSAIGLSSDCRRLLVPCDQGEQVCLLDLPEGRELCRLDVPTAPYGTMAICPDGRHAVTSDGNGAVYLFRLPDPRRPLKLRPGDGALTVEFAEKAVEQKPYNGQVLNTLGKVYYRAGRWQDAIRTLDLADAVGYAEDTWFSPFILAMSHWQAGDREQARKLYQVGLVWLARRGAGDQKLLRFRAEAASLLGLPETLSPEEEQARADDVKYYTLVVEVRPDAIWASFRRAGLLEQRKEWDKAAADYRRVVEVVEKRVAERPLDALCRRRLAWAHQELARVLLYHLSQPGEAAKSRQRQVALLEQLVSEFPRDPGHREQLGHSYRWRAFDFERMKQPLEAERAFGQATEYLEQLVQDFPESPGYRGMLADTYDRLHQLLAAGGKPHEAATAFDKTIRVLEGFPAERATTPPVRAALSDLHFRRGNLLREAQRLDDAAAAYHQAIDVQDRLAAEHPRERPYRHELGRYHNWLGIVLQQKGRSREAERAHRQAFTIYEQLTQEHDPSAGHSHRRELAWTCLNLGEALEKDRRVEEAMGLYRRAGALCEKLAAENPDSTYPLWGTDGYGKLTVLLAAADRAQEAEQACRKLLELKPDASVSHFKYALLRLHLGGRDAHRAACADMLTRFGNTSDPEDAHWTAWACTLGPDAVSDWQPVVRLAETALAVDPKNCDRLQLLAAVLYRAGRFEEAVKRLTEAEVAFQEAQNPRSTVIYNWLFQAMTRHRLGQADEARKWLEKAVEAIDQPPEQSRDANAMVWNRRLTLQLWQREAQTQLGKE